MNTTLNEHVEALRTLGRTLPKEQMFICFNAANAISTLERKSTKTIDDLDRREKHWWKEHCVQMKRADELHLKLYGTTDVQ